MKFIKRRISLVTMCFIILLCNVNINASDKHAEEIPQELYYNRIQHIHELYYYVIPEEEKIDNVYKYKINLTNEEKNILAALIWHEAGNQSYECQKAVGSVVINRMILGYGNSGKYNSKLKNVIYAPKQFCGPNAIKRCRQTEVQYKVVEDICKNGSSLPVNMLWFKSKNKAGTYHKKYGKPYKQIGAMYFSIKV